VATIIIASGSELCRKALLFLSWHWLIAYSLLKEARECRFTGIPVECVSGLLELDSIEQPLNVP
jgi:hypothetical protein